MFGSQRNLESLRGGEMNEINRIPHVIEPGMTIENYSEIMANITKIAAKNFFSIGFMPPMTIQFIAESDKYEARMIGVIFEG